MDSPIEKFYKISQCSSDLKECLTNSDLKEEDYNNLIERHIAASYNENQPICDFIEGADWLNIKEPLSLHIHLRNKIIVLDFWTYCCINCLHMLPELKKLEDLYSSNVVFIGVHSAKFDHEKDTENVKNAVFRHNVTHPVINDHGAMWSALGITCWPTLLVLGPNCRPLYIQIGEGGFNVLDRYLKICLKYFNAELDKTALNIVNINQKSSSKTAALLNYPGKVASFKTKQYTLLAISDSANNRIIVIKNDTEIIKIIGSSKRGYKDGDVATAMFANPQGIAFYNENIIFVADCENHCIRRIDLLQKVVTTVAGNGAKVSTKYNDVNTKVLNAEMRSPWGLTLYVGNDIADEASGKKNKKYILFIAMAGSHQIWALFLDTCVWWKNQIYNAGICVVISGTGNEENRNNSYPMSAAFAQPSGLSVNYADRELYVADSESSTIRRISLNNGKVSLIVGGERDPFNLFAYGDADGTSIDAKLKHPLAVAWSPKYNSLFVADTFNNKIKIIDIKTNTITSCWNAQLGLKEPGGLCIHPDEDHLIIADTNNNCLKKVNIRDGSSNIMNFDFEKPQQKNVPSRNIMTPDSIFQKTVSIGNISQVSFSVRFIESSIKLNRDVKQNWKVRLANNKNSVKKQEVCDNIFKVTLDLDRDCATDDVQMMFRLALCTGEICFMKMFALDYKLQREIDISAPYKNYTENTLVTIENNEMKVISSIATTT